MTKKLSSLETENISAGKIGAFCAGFGAVAAVYEVGVLANFWNPVGWTGAVAGAVVGVGCAIQALS